MTIDARIPAWRIVLAFAAAPGIASFALAVFQPAYAGLDSPWEQIWRTAIGNAMVGAYPPTIVLGLPIFLAVRKRLRPSLFNCAGLGALVAAAPGALLGLCIRPDYAEIDGHVTQQNGFMTLWGVLQLTMFVGTIGLAGSLGGAAFWLIAAGPKSRATGTAK